MLEIFVKNVEFKITYGINYYKYNLYFFTQHLHKDNNILLIPISTMDGRVK